MISGNAYGLKLLVLHLDATRNLLLEALPKLSASRSFATFRLSAKKVSLSQLCQFIFY
jgi:hypothetical protein